MIVEDDPLFRKYLAKFLTAISGVEVTGVFAERVEFLNHVQKLKPEILFLDVGLSGISGIQVADRVRRDFPYMEIVFITADENHIRDAFHLYASLTSLPSLLIQTDYTIRWLGLEKNRQCTER